MRKTQENRMMNKIAQTIGSLFILLASLCEDSQIREVGSNVYEYMGI
jgi:hypothetical protein